MAITKLYMVVTNDEYETPVACDLIGAESVALFLDKNINRVRKNLCTGIWNHKDKYKAVIEEEEREVMEEYRQCIICHKTFLAKKKSVITCSPECSYENRKFRSHEYHARKREEKENKALSHKNLINIADEARKAGMSYGQYVSQMGL